MSKKEKLRGKDLLEMGYMDNTLRSLAMQIVGKGYKHQSAEEQLAVLRALIDNPAAYREDAILSPLALRMIDEEVKARPQYDFQQRDFAVYGASGIDDNTLQQMRAAMSLPITISGALMPDAHYGYGLPIGGVLATENAVIPYGVGVDIACRMCLSVFDLGEDVQKYIKRYRVRLRKMLLDNTRFGFDVFDDKQREDELFDRNTWQNTQILRQLKDKAYQQVGSSGGGNHFVDMGVLDIADDKNAWNLPAGQYFALLSHSGSRGTGARIADHYTKMAMKKRDLPKELAHLAWFDLGEEEGAEYWEAMNLAGDYASANHHHIHRRIAKDLSAQPVFMLENHHNFAWKEEHNGKELIVHRKGATPADKGEMGIIPGSMASPAFIVRGRGEEKSLKSASHGAGRLMSRRKAVESFTSSQMKSHLHEHGVELMGGGLDEAPFVYKDIQEVMRAQTDLVDILATFHPKIVRMATDTEGEG